METSLLNQWFSGQEIKAICWTLIHSLWIGLVIALLCGIIIAATHKSAAVLRYRLLCSLLVLFVCSIGVTYYLEAGSAPVVQHLVSGPASLGIAQYHIGITPISATQNQSLLNNIQAFLNQNTTIIFLVWLLFFMLKSLKMASGLLYIQRIRNYKTHAVSDELKHKIEYFSKQIGIARAVRLMQSELVKVPVAVGWLKPMILLPVGITFQLTPEQLDGILWHELAHIRRRDYLVNILQGLVETVFFFNPGLLWLSSLIRIEREACCDDMVLSRMNRKANYLEALLSFGYGEFNQAKYAMSIGSGNQLRDRLKRMISQENKRLSLAEKLVLVVGLALLTALTAISKDSPIVKHLTVRFNNKPGKAVVKTFPVYMHRLPLSQRVNDYKPGARIKDSLILTDTAIRFSSVLFKHSDADLANNDIDALDDKGNKYHLIVNGGNIASMEINGVEVADDKLADYAYVLRAIISELDEKRRIRGGDIARFKAGNPDARFQAAKLQPWKDTLKSAGRADREPAKLQGKRYSADAASDVRAAKYAAMLDRRRNDSIGYTGQLRRVEQVINDLVKDKVVAGAADVKWFGLSNTEFIVNGKKLSPEMQQRYMAKYGVRENYGLYYGPVQMYGTGVFIDAMANPVSSKGPWPKYMGAVKSSSQDSILWQQRQLIKQQQLFADKENEKRRQMMLKQQNLLDEQNDKLEQARKRKWPQLRDPGSAGIDLEAPVYNVIADLVGANVISDKSDLIRFNLTNGALIVNGKKQAEELHERLKLKYLGPSTSYPKDDYRTSPNYGLHYNAQTGNSGIGVTSGPDSP